MTAGLKRWFTFPPGRLTADEHVRGDPLQLAAQWAAASYPRINATRLAGAHTPREVPGFPTPAPTARSLRGCLSALHVPNSLSALYGVFVRATRALNSFFGDFWPGQDAGDLLECVQRPGEIFYLPALWPHLTLNLAPAGDLTLAVGAQATFDGSDGLGRPGAVKQAGGSLCGLGFQGYFKWVWKALNGFWILLVLGPGRAGEAAAGGRAGRRPGRHTTGVWGEPRPVKSFSAPLYISFVILHTTHTGV